MSQFLSQDAVIRIRKVLHKLSKLLLALHNILLAMRAGWWNFTPLFLTDIFILVYLSFD